MEAIQKESQQSKKEVQDQMIKERIKNLGEKMKDKSLFKELVQEEESEEEDDDRSKSSESSNEGDFYEQLSDGDQHVPMVGGGLPAGFGGGIPKPRKPDQPASDLRSETESKDFRITSTMSSASGKSNPVKRTYLVGLGKPHSMAAQNE